MKSTTLFCLALIQCMLFVAKAAHIRKESDLKRDKNMANVEAYMAKRQKARYADVMTFNKDPYAFDTFNLAIKVCDATHSGTDMWLNVRLRDQLGGECVVLRFNPKQSLWRGKTFLFNNLKCQPLIPQYGLMRPQRYPSAELKSIEFKGTKAKWGRNDLFCIDKVLVKPLGGASKKIYEASTSKTEWIGANAWRKFPAELEISGLVHKTEARKGIPSIA